MAVGRGIRSEGLAGGMRGASSVIYGPIDRTCHDQKEQLDELVWNRATRTSWLARIVKENLFSRFWGTRAAE